MGRLILGPWTWLHPTTHGDDGDVTYHNNIRPTPAPLHTQFNPLISTSCSSSSINGTLICTWIPPPSHSFDTRAHVCDERRTQFIWLAFHWVAGCVCSKGWSKRGKEGCLDCLFPLITCFLCILFVWERERKIEPFHSTNQMARVHTHTKERHLFSPHRIINGSNEHHYYISLSLVDAHKDSRRNIDVGMRCEKKNLWR